MTNKLLDLLKGLFNRPLRQDPMDTKPTAKQRVKSLEKRLNTAEKTAKKVAKNARS